VTYTATLDAAAKGTVTVSLSNGQTITIADGKTSGSVQLTVPPQDDVYTENKSINAKHNESPRAAALKSLRWMPRQPPRRITDTIDTTTVHLSATDSITEAGGQVTYTATLDALRMEQ